MKSISLRIAILLTAALAAHGSTFYVNVSNFSQLQAAYGDQLWLGFEVTDGSGTGDGNSVAVLSNFQSTCPTCLSPTGTPLTFGGAAGDLASTVALADSPSFAFFQQEILYEAQQYWLSGGDNLTFQLQLFTSTPEADGSAPDGFFFFIMDGNGNPLPTTAPDGASFLSAAFDVDSPTVNAYSWSNPDSAFSVDASYATDTPEPAGLAVLGLGALLVFRKRLRRPGS